MPPKDAPALWQTYERFGRIEVRPWTAEDAEAFSASNIHQRLISVSQPDVWGAMKCNPPQGYVARNPDNHADQWYIAPEYFAKHYRPAPVDGGVSDDVLDGLDEMAGVTAVKGKLLRQLIAEIRLSRRASAPLGLTEREALERAAKANEGMARICHAAGKSFETQQHLHDAATLRSLANRAGDAGQAEKGEG